MLKYLFDKNSKRDKNEIQEWYFFEETNMPNAEE